MLAKDGEESQLPEGSQSHFNGNNFRHAGRRPRVVTITRRLSVPFQQRGRRQMPILSLSQLPEGSQSHFNFMRESFMGKLFVFGSQLPEGSQSHFNTPRMAYVLCRDHGASQLPEGSQSHFNYSIDRLPNIHLLSQLPEGSQSHFNNKLHLVAFQSTHCHNYPKALSPISTCRKKPFHRIPHSSHNYPKALSPISTLCLLANILPRNIRVTITRRLSVPFQPIVFYSNKEGKV